MSYPITGFALANCLGTTTDVVVERAFAGDSAFLPAAEVFDVPFATVLGAMPALAPGPELACAMTRVATIALASVRQIKRATDAAIERWGAARVAYVFASSTGGLEETERTLAPDPRLPVVHTYRYANHVIDATVAAVMQYLGLAGIHLTVSTACSSGLTALASAARLIDRGLADAAVVGSADSLSRTTVFGFHSLGLLAPTATRPMSRDRAGITLGEGSAYVVIERSTEATRAAALATLSGTGAACDAYHHTTPHPEGRGGQQAMRETLDRARLSPNVISYVSAHGTGTAQNDATEALAVGRVFERLVPVTATKSVTGHTLGTAGLTSIALAIESVRRQHIPPTARVTADPALGVRVVDALVAADIEHVLVNGFGFGGSNASAVVSRVDAR
ncbi:MAG TPA: beta-ketoacyl synthase N-terminal-like domain-containing protein [Kofleriaceae bacterium]|nr:beta-ketoacyl synthase N-terminal-like domain-containing protein [Kofleriaceae bacterium]